MSGLSSASSTNGAASSTAEAWDNCQNLQIFLGGSCNPTTWRQTIAIPYLETKGISYYNPQVDNWTPEIVNLERKAKQSANILLFVIDRQTRSTVSIVESAFMAGGKRKLVIVMYPFEHHDEILNIEALRSGTKSIIRICDEILSEKELRELRQARIILQCLASLQEIPLFTDIKQALSYITTRLKGDVVRLEGGLEPRHSSHLQNHHSSDIKTSCSVRTSRQKAVADVRNDIYLSFDDYDHRSIGEAIMKVLDDKGLSYNYMSVNKFMDSNIPSEKPSMVLSDIIEDSTGPIDILTSNQSHIHHLDTRIRLAMEEEMNVIRSSRVLLFVISNRCRGLSIMVLASYFMAFCRDNVVLCVQDLEEPCSIEDEQLTKTAISDYNRGRVYLRDYAHRSQIPLFSTINEAVECCSQRCGG